MPSEPKRKLTAIMFIDMVGYTAMMQKDERRTQDLVKRQRELIKPLVVKHSGEVHRYIGDGTLCTFRSAIEAVNCAVDIQKALKDEDELNLRIGIHIGDIVFEGDDIYGDGVNIASRIEPLAEPGGICVTEEVYRNIKNQSGLSLTSLGKKELKNVDEDIVVYVVTTAAEPAPVTSEIQKPTSASSKNFLKWIAAAAITALVIVGLKIDFGTMEVESNSEISNLRIAVLPFDNMSSDPENEFFADGITDDILAQLAKIKSLEVISRTSSMQYKNTTKSLRQISKELGVATILEGSVRRGGNRVRIIAQLIDARTDKHLWAETYDRDLDDIFAIQSDVAKKIAAALEASLTPEEEKRIEQKPTENLEAYDFYLRGNIYSQRSEDKSDFDIAIKMYQKAIDLDPNFALAYAELSRNHSAYYFFYYDRSEERLVQAREAADKALQINSLLPQAHLALGTYYYHGRLDYLNALNEFEVAREMGLNNSKLYANIGYVRRRQGKMEQAKDNLLKAFELDPRGAITAFNLAETYALLRNYPEAEKILNRAISLSPDVWKPHYFKSFLALRWKGDIKKARAVLKEADQNIGSLDEPLIIYLKYLLEIYDRQFQIALDLLLSEKYDVYQRQFFYYHKYHLMAKTYGLMDGSGMEQSYYDSARVVYESALKENPDDSRLYSSLGLVYAGLGRKEDAIRAGKRGVDLLPISREAWRGAYRLEDLAVIYAKVGEFDTAIDHIETLLSVPSLLSVSLLRLDTKWDPLRKHPRFIALLEE